MGKDKYIYELNIGEVGLKNHLNELLKSDNVLEEWNSRGKDVRNYDFFLNKVCPKLSLCETDEEFKTVGLEYLEKLSILDDYGFDLIGLLYDITEKVSDLSEYPCCEDLFGITRDEKVITKTFTDGDKGESIAIYHSLNMNDDYAVTIESELSNQSYWFDVTYFIEDEKVTNSVNRKINIIDMDFDLNTLPNKEEIDNYKLEYNDQTIDVIKNLSENIDIDSFIEGKAKTLKLSL